MKENNLISKTNNQSSQTPQENNSNLENTTSDRFAAFTKSSNYKDEDYIHYSYKIKNKITGKYYIGIHSFPKDLGYNPECDGYWGSGTKIREAIKTEGRSNFEKEILKIFSTRQELSDEEKRLVTIKELNDPMCYNSTLGGDDNFKNNMGWVVCRPKSAINKIIKIPREEYYKNKDLYIPTGHIRYYLTGPKARNSVKSSRRKRKNWSQKIDESDTLYSRRRNFVNKDTLEIKTFIGHDGPDNLYKEWFPIYFYDKVNKIFIDEYVFAKKYKEIHNMNNIAKNLHISKRSVYLIKSHYESIGVRFENNKLRPGNINGFSGKCFVNKDGKYYVINKSDLQSYLNNGYVKGKGSKTTSGKQILKL